MQDMCVSCGNGIVNIRVGAIIIKDEKLLMVGNDQSNYLYSIGGRIKMGETAEEAIIREVFEETGVKMSVDRLGFVHENYFYGDTSSNLNKLIYEISFYFYMHVPNDFNPVSQSFTELQNREFLYWVERTTSRIIYPEFFRTDILNSSIGVQHIVTDSR
jgi:ADP-ribose pyrophosphatase YjhB (NUDIX family)